MQQLTGMDAAFLDIETAEMPMHVLGIVLLAPEDDGVWSFRRLRELLLERIHLMPPFRQRLVDVPLGLDLPYWIQDGEFDVDRHLTRVTASQGSDEHTLSELAAVIASERLDRSRPLWELSVIEGLSGGRVALVAKIHHCAVYGAAGADLIAHLFDFDAAGRTADAPESEFVGEQPPPSIALAAKGALKQATSPARLARTLAGTAGRLGTLATTGVRQVRSQGRSALPFAAPRTSLNGALTPRRSIAFARASLSDATAVKDRYDVKLNDVVLAATASALRKYLAKRDALPGRPLIASCPMAVGQSTETTNVLSAMLAPLDLEISDPVVRLKTIADATRGSKEMAGALGADMFLQMAELTPRALIATGVRLYSGLRLSALHPPMQSLIVSNIPGPPIPLYVAGAAVEAIYPMGPLLPGTGLNMTVISNQDALDVGLVGCPDLVEDVWEIADGFVSGIAELSAT